MAASRAWGGARAGRGQICCSPFPGPAQGSGAVSLVSAATGQGRGCGVRKQNGKSFLLVSPAPCPSAPPALRRPVSVGPPVPCPSGSLVCFPQGPFQKGLEQPV